MTTANGADTSLCQFFHCPNSLLLSESARTQQILNVSILAVYFLRKFWRRSVAVPSWNVTISACRISAQFVPLIEVIHCFTNFQCSWIALAQLHRRPYWCNPKSPCTASRNRPLTLVVLYALLYSRFFSRTGGRQII